MIDYAPHLVSIFDRYGNSLYKTMPIVARELSPIARIRQQHAQIAQEQAFALMATQDRHGELEALEQPQERPPTVPCPANRHHHARAIAGGVAVWCPLCQKIYQPDAVYQPAAATPKKENLVFVAVSLLVLVILILCALVW